MDSLKMNLRLLLFVFLFIGFGKCRNAGNCTVDVLFDNGVDTDVENENGDKISKLLKSVHVNTPMTCISECCSDELCTNVVYSLSSGRGENENCFLYQCPEHQCPRIRIPGEYLYNVNQITTEIAENVLTTLPTTVFVLSPTTTVSEDLEITKPQNSSQKSSTPIVTSTLVISTTKATSGQILTTPSTKEIQRSMTKEKNLTTTTNQLFFTDVMITTLGKTLAKTTGIKQDSTAGTTHVQSTVSDNGGLSNSNALTSLFPRSRSPNVTPVDVYNELQPFQSSHGVLITFVVFGIMILLTTIYVVSSRVRESLKNYRYRHYRKVEYLINDGRWQA